MFLCVCVGGRYLHYCSADRRSSIHHPRRPMLHRTQFNAATRSPYNTRTPKPPGPPSATAVRTHHLWSCAMGRGAIHQLPHLDSTVFLRKGARQICMFLWGAAENTRFGELLHKRLGHSRPPSQVRTSADISRLGYLERGGDFNTTECS